MLNSKQPRLSLLELRFPMLPEHSTPHTKHHEDAHAPGDVLDRNATTCHKSSSEEKTQKLTVSLAVTMQCLPR